MSCTLGRLFLLAMFFGGNLWAFSFKSFFSQRKPAAEASPEKFSDDLSEEANQPEIQTILNAAAKARREVRAQERENRRAVPQPIRGMIESYNEQIYGTVQGGGFQEFAQKEILDWENSLNERSRTWFKIKNFFSPSSPPARPFQWNDPRLKRFENEGLALREELEKILWDSQIEEKEKIASAYTFVRNVLIPARQFYTQIYDPNNIINNGQDPSKKLLPRLPADVFENGKNLALIIVGLGDGSIKGSDNSPHGLKAEKSSDGKSLQLSYDPVPTLINDLKGLAQAPTAYNTVRMLKLQALHMLMSQLSFYASVLGESKPFEIPRRCQQRINGELPGLFSFDYALPEFQSEKIDKFLEDYGLRLSDGKSQAYDYYVESQKFDPSSKTGFPNSLPHQEIVTAQIALDPKTPPELQPGMDAVRDFDLFYEMKIWGNKETIQASSADDTEFKKYKEAFTMGSDKEGPYAHLTQFLIDKMKAKGTKNWEIILPGDIKKYLTETRVSIDLAPLRGPEDRRRLTFGWLAQLIEERSKAGEPPLDSEAYFQVREKYAAFDLIFEKAICPRKYLFWGGCDSKELLNQREKINKLLAPYMPRDRIENPLPFTTPNSELEKVYPQLKTLFSMLRDEGLIKHARSTELNYLRGEIGQNPWAALRLSYLIQYGPMRRNIYLEATGLTKVSDPYLLDRIISLEEKIRYWENIKKNHDPASQYALQAKTKGGKTGYEKIQEVESSVLLTPQDANVLVDKMDAQKSFKKTNKIREELETLSKDPRIIQGQRLLEIYNARDDFDKQLELYENYRSDFPNEDVRNVFMEVNMSFKRPLYKQILIDGARSAQKEVRKQLTTLCNAQPLDLSSFKESYRVAAFAQTEMLQTLGMSELPPSFKKEFDRWTKSDYWEAGLKTANLVGCAGGVLSLGVCGYGSSGFGAGFCGALASTLLSTCSLTSAGLAVDFAFEKVQSKDRERTLKRFYETGQLSQSQYKEFVDKPSAWDAVFAVLGVAFAPELSMRGFASAFRKFMGSEHAFFDATIAADREILRMNASLGKQSLSRNLLRESSRIPVSTVQVEKSAAKTIADFVSAEQLMEKLEAIRSRILKMEDLIKRLVVYEHAADLNLLQRLWAKTGLPFTKLEKLRAQVASGKKLSRVIEELGDVRDRASYLSFLEENADSLQLLIELMPVSIAGTAIKWFSYDNSIPTFMWKTPRPTEIVLKRISRARENLLFQSQRLKAAKELGVTEEQFYKLTQSDLLIKYFSNLSSEVRALSHVNRELNLQREEFVDILAQELTKLFPKKFGDLEKSRQILFKALSQESNELAEISIYLDKISLEKLFNIFDDRNIPINQLAKHFDYSNAADFEKRRRVLLEILARKRQPHLLN